MDRVYGDCGKTWGEEILNPGGRPTADVLYSYPGGGGSRTGRTALEAHDDGVVLPVLSPGKSSASMDGPATYPDVAMEPLITSAVPPATRRSDVVPYTGRITAHGAYLLPSGASAAPVPSSQSVVGAYPDFVVMGMDHHSLPSPAPARERGSMPCSDLRAAHPEPGASTAGPVIGESYYTDMLMAHLAGSSDDMSPAAWNNVASYPVSAALTPSAAAINGVVIAYPGPGGRRLNLQAAVTAGPDTNAVGSGYVIDVYQGMADFDFAQHLHPGTGTAAAATEPGGGYYYNKAGMAMAVPFAARAVDEAVEADSNVLVAQATVSQDEVAGAVAEPVRGGPGGLGPAVTSLAMAGLIAGGVDTPCPVAAIALFGMLIAGVIMVTVRVFRS